MNDTRHLRFVFELDGQDVTVAAHGDNRVLKKFLLARVVQDVKNFALDSALSTFEVAANFLQFDACRVANGAVFVDRVVELTFQVAQNFNFVCTGFQLRRVDFGRLEKTFDLPHGVHCRQHVQKFFGVGDTSEANFFERFAHVTKSAERRRTHGENFHGLGRQRKIVTHGFNVVDGFKFNRQLLAEIA